MIFSNTFEKLSDLFPKDFFTELTVNVSELLKSLFERTSSLVSKNNMEFFFGFKA